MPAAIYNPTATDTLTNLTTLIGTELSTTQPPIPNNHGILIRNGPIGLTANTDTLQISYLGTSSPPSVSLAPGEAFVFEPADAESTDEIFIISTGTSTPFVAVIAG